MSRRYAIILAAALLFTLSGCGEEKKEQANGQQRPEPPPIPVEFITVEQEDIPIWLEFTGKTEATRRIEVRARVSGRLEEVSFNEGDYVEQGEKLFVIEPDVYEAALQKSMAGLESNKASLALARADVKRYEPLVAEGLAPRINLEQAQARAAELVAAIKADQALIKEAELNLSYTTVTAPISGRISRKLVDVGNIVGYGEKTILTTIVADNPMYAYFNPTEEQFQIMRKYKIQEEMDARVRVPMNNVGLLERPLYKGEVSFSDNVIDRSTSTITMRAEVENPEHDLLEGTFVYVEVFLTDEAPLLMVSPAAMQEDQRGAFVYVIDETGKAKRMDVLRGYETRHLVMIPEGISVGDKVLISGLAKVREGSKLDPTDVTATKGLVAKMRENQMIPSK